MAVKEKKKKIKRSLAAERKCTHLPSNLLPFGQCNLLLSFGGLVERPSLLEVGVYAKQGEAKGLDLPLAEVIGTCMPFVRCPQSSQYCFQVAILMES